MNSQGFCILVCEIALYSSPTEFFYYGIESFSSFERLSFLVKEHFGQNIAVCGGIQKGMHKFFYELLIKHKK